MPRVGESIFREGEKEFIVANFVLRILTMAQMLTVSGLGCPVLLFSQAVAFKITLTK